jgi:hypothetical protein
MGGFRDLFGRKEKSRTTLSKASTSSNRPRASVGQNGGLCTYSEDASQPRSKPRTTSSTALANKPWLSVGEYGEISTLSEYAHPSRLSPQQRSQEYPRPQPHPQAHPQPRSYPHPAQGLEQPAARQPIPTKAKHYLPPQHTNRNPSYSVAGSFAHQPTVRGAGNKNRGFRSSPPRQRSTQLSIGPLPSLGYVIGSYGNSNPGPPNPVSSRASARGQPQGWASNKPLSLSTPGPSGQGQFQEFKANRTPSPPVSPMDSQWPEFPSRNVYHR